MIKIIELKDGVGRLANSEPFLLPDELKLEFTSNKDYNLDNAFITLYNNSEKTHEKLTNPYVVKDNLLFGGLLTGKVTSYVGDVLVKTWTILPLKLVETDKGTEVKDYVSTIEERVAELENQVQRLNKQHEIIY